METLLTLSACISGRPTVSRSVCACGFASVRPDGWIQRERDRESYNRIQSEERTIQYTTPSASGSRVGKRYSFPTSETERERERERERDPVVELAFNCGVDDGVVVSTVSL
jgi:hypothetical protein